MSLLALSLFFIFGDVIGSLKETDLLDRAGDGVKTSGIKIFSLDENGDGLRPTGGARRFKCFGVLVVFE